MNYFEMDYRNYKRNPQGQQICTDFEIKMEQVFETLETADIHRTTIIKPNMIKTNVNNPLETPLTIRIVPNQR